MKRTPSDEKPKVLIELNAILSGKSNESNLLFLKKQIFILLVTFAYLSELDIRSYLEQSKVISKKEDDNIVVNEKNLIANRLIRKSILAENNMKICPKHRSSFGIDWFSRNATCHHPEHDSGHSSAMKDSRRVKLTTCLKIEGFPIGGR